MEAKFQRHDKYVVLKLADIDKHLPDDQQLKLDALVTKIRIGRLKEGKTDQAYVCVAADWPMYEQVWSMVQAFVEGKPNEIDELRQQLAAANARISELEAQSEPVAWGVFWRLDDSLLQAYRTKYKAESNQHKWQWGQNYVAPLYLRAPQAVPEEVLAFIRSRAETGDLEAIRLLAAAPLPEGEKK